LAVSCINLFDMFLSAWSGDEVGVNTPLVVSLLGLLTKGKLRLVPVESKDDTDGRCKDATAELDTGRRKTEERKLLSELWLSELSSRIGEGDLSLFLAVPVLVMLDMEDTDSIESETAGPAESAGMVSALIQALSFSALASWYWSWLSAQ